MPIYEYLCQSCGHEHEALQKLSDPPLTLCPSCNRNDLMKKISAAGFRLKGSGWYETDFKNNGKKNVPGESNSSTSTSDAPAKPHSCSGNCSH
jgi:putative FmdB family regulatory protein